MKAKYMTLNVAKKVVHIRKLIEEIGSLFYIKEATPIFYNTQSVILYFS